MELYCLTFPNNKKYIGITSKTVQQRFNAHCAIKESRRNACQHAIHKFGKENILLTTLAITNSWELLCLAEIEVIEKYNTFGSEGYNLTIGSEGYCINSTKTSKDYSETYRLSNSEYIKKYTEKYKEQKKLYDIQYIAKNKEVMKQKAKVKLANKIASMSEEELLIKKQKKIAYDLVYKERRSLLRKLSKQR